MSTTDVSSQDSSTVDETPRDDSRSGASDADTDARGSDGQARLIEHERRKLTALIGNDDIAFIVVDSGNRIVWANEVFRSRFDRSGGDGPFLGMTCNQLLCGKGKPCAECPSSGSLRTGEVTHHELRLWLDDRFQQVYVTAMPVPQAEGEEPQTIVMLQDVSGLEILRRSEEAFRASEQRFRSVFDGVAAGMVTLKTDGTLLQVNPAFCTLLGFTSSDLLRKDIADLLHPEDRQSSMERLREVLDGRRRVSEIELRLLRRDGAAVWAHTHIVLQLDEQNRPAFAVALIQEITQRKQAQHNLEQSKQRYEALVNSMDGIVWEALAESPRFSFISPRVEQILGFPVERWLTQPRFWRNRIHPEDLDEVIEAYSRGIEGGAGFELEYRMLAADGRAVWLRDTVNVIHAGDGQVKLSGIMVDITEKKRAEEALAQSEGQLRQAQKMEAIGRLAAGIAHDFNNLLTTIAGYGDFLVRGLGGNHPLTREAQEIIKASGRAGELTRQLLAFSRQQVLLPEVLDLNASVGDMDVMLRRVIGEDIELNVVLEQPLGSVVADPGQIQQVILNLAVNARDAMRGGGRLTLETMNLEVSENDPLVLSGLGPGSYVHLRVSDTGSGMDDETLMHLFEPFYTTKEQGKGTGLGLSTVYGIVKQSGGHILVESSPGHGSTFSIYLDRAESVPLPKAEPTHVAGDLPQGTETILLVEDDDPVRELARRILEMSGYSVIEACNGVEALELCRASEDPIDMIATDLVMPQMGGRDLAEQAARALPEIKVLFLSGYTSEELLKDGRLEAGACFLQKPFTPAGLSRRVREILDR